MEIQEVHISLSPKKAFEQYCDHYGIEVEHTRSRRSHHVHVYAPYAQQFSGHGVDNLGLWDSVEGAPDWRWCLKEVERAMPLEIDPDDEPLGE